MNYKAGIKQKLSLGKIALRMLGIVLALQILSGCGFSGEVTDTIRPGGQSGVISPTDEVTQPQETQQETTHSPQNTDPPQADPEVHDRYPSWPSELRDHFLIGSRDQGISATLTGDVLITVIFVNDPTSTWTADTMAAAKAKDADMTGKILSAAAAYGAKINITIEYLQTTVSTTEDADSKVWAEQVISGAGLGSVSTASKELERTRGVKEAPILLYVNATERSYASTNTGTDTEYAIVWRGSDVGNTGMHELFHLFGAVDLYMPTAVKACAQRYFPDSVMLGGESPLADELTAYLIGWTDTLSDQALAFLRETAHVTQENSAQEIEQETHTGYVENWKKHNGCIITGYLDFGVLEGQGKVIEPNGGWREGYFEYGALIRGKAKYIYEDGSWYEGSIDHGDLNGQGTMVWVGGERYTGQWKGGTYHGSGKLTQSNGSWYEGSFEEGNFVTGQCKIIYDDGGRFEGRMERGSLNGQGTMVWASGESYTGQWKNDKYHGWGRLTGANGNWYEGTFEESNFISGRCRILYDGGGWYEGDWANGTINGQGTMVWASGDRYTGSFRNGKLHGYGTYTKSDGTVFAGNWEDSNFIG